MPNSRAPSAPTRLAYLVTHPIQYQAPLLRRIAAEPDIDLTVFFGSDHSARAYNDPGFGRDVAWGVPLLDGYRHEVLPALGGANGDSIWRPLNYGLPRRLREGRFDFLWVHGYARPYHLWAMAAARALGLRVLLRDESTLVSAQRSPSKRVVKRGFFAGLRRVCDGFLAVGELNRQYYRSYGIPSERIFLMPYAVDNDHFHRRARAADLPGLRRSMQLEPDRPVILFAAKLIGRKRPGDLLQAFARLQSLQAARRPYLLFVGDGILARTLAQAAARDRLEDVRFAGFRDQTELPRFYGLADVLVLPSERESWGLVLNEAMAAGAAIIASDRVGAAADLVRNGENGFVYPVGDIDALTAALARILAEPERGAAMGRRSRDIIDHWSFAEDVAGLRTAMTAFPARQTRR